MLHDFLRKIFPRRHKHIHYYPCDASLYIGAEDTLCYRLVYFFSISDSMTLVLSPSGDIMSHRGTRDFEHSPKKEKVYALIKNLTRFYCEKAKPYLYAGRMTAVTSRACIFTYAKFRFFEYGK